MGSHFVRVMRGNFDQAVRAWTRATQHDPQYTVLRGRPFHEKPTERRRRKGVETLRRHEKAALFSNLRVILARKARGF